MRCCGKCGRSVAEVNDALTFELVRSWVQKFGPDYNEAQVDRWELTAYVAQGMRHLMPIIEGGEVVCEGSPSRAQYFEGVIRDSRGYPYDTELEAEFREARRQQLLRYANGRDPFAELTGTEASATN